MMRIRSTWTVSLLSAIWIWIIWGGISSCMEAHSEPRPSEGLLMADPSGTVDIISSNGGFKLLRDGNPFYVRGACIIGTEHLAALKAAGGNTVRTYPGIDLDEVFRVADSLGLAVIPGLDVKPMRHGLDYRDSAAVAKMKARVREQVLCYKDEPALLMWGLGNEVHLLHEHAEGEIFAAIDDVSRMVHELDPNHPTTYMTDGPMGFLKVWRACTELDVISVNLFRSISKFKKVLTWSNWFFDQPVLISEWAPAGYWSASTTTWGAPVEENGQEKAVSYTTYYQEHLTEEEGVFLGSCLFLWGQKQERTHTWFSIFSEQGDPTILVDEITNIWTGTYPMQRAPLAQDIQLASYQMKEEVILYANQEYWATGYAVDSDDDSLTYEWEITREYLDYNVTGGDAEKRPAPITDLCLEMVGERMYFRAPEEVGAYRIYFTVRDPDGKVGTTNVPFFVLLPPQLDL